MMLEVESLSHQYGSEHAVRDVSFELASGELLALLGPSGCGKTTILQAIAGHIRPTSGRIRLRGVDVTGDPPESRQVSIVFQQSTLYPHMTVEENVAYGLKARNIDASRRASLVTEYLDLVALTDQREAYPGELSGGQQRRVELARALAPQPDVLLLDEPLSALDRTLREQLRDEIARIQRETGVTTLFVTHDQEDAMSLADRLVVMNGGSVSGIGEPRQLYESPPTPFVASFLGRSDCLSLDVDGTGTEHACYIRPEDVTLAGPNTNGSDVCLPGTVTRVSDLGKRYDVAVTLESGEELTVEQRVDPPSEDEAVTIQLDREEVIRFG